MPIIDSHCHVSESWYEPVEVLLHQMDRNGVAGAILIQMFGQVDNAYQAACVGRYPDRLASVVLVDADRPDAPATLARLAEVGAVGVRLRPTTRSPGDDPLAIWRAAERLGLAVSCGGTGGDAGQFATDAFAGVIEAVPRLTVVVEHLGTTGHLGTDEVAVRDRIFGLARYPNVCMKMPGLGEIARRALPARAPFPFEEPVPPLIEAALAAFGPARLMWGSDYPPVSHREGYRNALHLVQERLADLDEAARGRIFGGTAQAVFPIRP